MIDLYNDLESNHYPGRGIIFGISADNQYACMAYFIMGRSVNSRNRLFVPNDGGIGVVALNPDLVTDPSLVFYQPVRVINQYVTIVTNGDQTDTIAEYLSRGETFEAALRTRTYEPDHPHHTPRISGILTVHEGNAQYTLSLIKSSRGNGGGAQRFFYEYPVPSAGEGHFIHTYKTDGDPLPSFTGEPKHIKTTDGIDQFTVSLWNSLNDNNKVSLFTRCIRLADGKTETRIINQYA